MNTLKMLAYELAELLMLTVQIPAGARMPSYSFQEEVHALLHRLCEQYDCVAQVNAAREDPWVQAAIVRPYYELGLWVNTTSLRGLAELHEAITERLLVGTEV